MFFLRVRTNKTTPATYSYYTGYVSSIKSQYASDGDSEDTYITCSGILHWTESTTDPKFLTQDERVAFLTADVTGLNQVNPTHTDWREATLDFSAYPPTTNGAYLLNRNNTQEGLRYSTTRGYNESAIRLGEKSSLPRRRQTGSLLLTKSKNKLTAVFAYPEIDTNYTVKLTPRKETLVSATAIDSSNYSTYKDYFVVTSVKKSNSFFTVEFGVGSGSAENKVSWDWEIARSY